MLVRSGERLFISLPGVPAELKGIFRGSLRPLLVEALGQGYFEQWKVHAACGDESVLAPLLRRAAESQRQVYVKSRARRFDDSQSFLITLSSRGRTRTEVESQLQTVWGLLQEQLAREGISTQEPQRTHTD